MGQLNHYLPRPGFTMGPGVSKIKHVAEIFGKAPVQMSDIVTRMFTANNGWLFSTFLRDFTQERVFDTDDEYTWKLIGSTYKNIPLLEARDEDGAVITNNGQNYGKGGAIIQLVFPENYFADGEVLVGELNEYYQFRILGDPTMEGNTAVYTCELMYGQETGCPAERLQPGERFSWEYAPVENELSRKVGGIRKAVPTSMRNEWTTIRKYNKFTGAADRQQKLDVSIPLIRINAQGKEEKTVINSWFSNEEWIFMQEWEREKERARLYSRSNRNSNGAYMNFGKSGNAIRVGDGLFAQMLYGNTSFYNNYGSNFSIKGLANAVYNICEQGNVPMDQRNFVVLTGQRGMIQVNEAIRKETNGWSAPFTFNGDNLGIIEKTSNPAHQTSLAYGAQFTEWRGPNGLVLKFIVDPSLDDRERNKIPGPNNQGVLSSYAYYIFDLGTSSEPNMFLCKLRNADDTFKYRIGIRNPWGITNNNIINYDEDSAEIHVMTTLGALILDPTRCLAYLPSGMVPA